MIYDGIPDEDLDQYLRARAWFTDAAQLLRLSQDDLASELVRSMTSSSAIVITTARSALPPSTLPWTSEPSTFPVQRAGRDALR
jgi:hypothetical protein